ncbi:hypothetical protein FEM48_Zijuj04G0141200 [Ziziphus jujuba var. spinosa]|uniref:Uncharacterized protein n=1 Tax=Ziziphus jujuba var. spinosa TaxID=714518 RepID=A0A978VKB6_ZIZJJ|nr:hypothetical protein FEM48_Zijuj04G0141200 [Ziziphus jujuba var. spinosa]
MWKFMSEFSSSDKFSVRLQRLVASLFRIPTFRPHLKNLVKLLNLEAVLAKASDNLVSEIFLASKNGGRNSVQNDDREIRDEIMNNAEYRKM